jgi:hypothetical protein
MNDKTMKRIDAAWFAAFGKHPELEIFDNSCYLIEKSLSISPAVDTVERRSILRAERVKVNGWAVSVEVSSYSWQHGPDSDVVDIGWRENLNAAILLMIEYAARYRAEDALYSEGLAEAIAEDKELAPKIKEYLAHNR